MTGGKELKRCPFCGGEADLLVQCGPNGYFMFAKCSFCGAMAKTFEIGPDLLGDGEEATGVRRAADAWNRRAEKA